MLLMLRRADEHSVVGITHVADVIQAQLLHGDETYVAGGAGYTGVAKRPEHAKRDIIWSIAPRPSIYKQHEEAACCIGSSVKSNTPRRNCVQSSSPLPGNQGGLKSSQGSVPWAGRKYSAVTQCIWISKSNAGQADLQRAVG